MNFDEYQKTAGEYDLARATTNLKDTGFIEKILGLVGEAGETAEKIKKILRDKDGKASKQDRVLITKELGDILWYVASIARYLNIPLSEVAELNIKKIESRRQRDKLHGEGDER